MAEMIRVLVADDDPLVRDTIREILVADGLSVVGEASNSGEAMRLAEALEPDVLLLDLKMPGPPAADVLGCLAARCQAVKVLVLTGRDDDESVQGMVAAGARGYFLKGETAMLAAAVRAVARGERWFSRQVMGTVLTLAQAQAVAAQTPALTEREMEVLRLIARGWTACRIAKALGITSPTVHYHRQRIAKKLGLRSRAELIGWAVRRGIA